jgi:hypothetical protein
MSLSGQKHCDAEEPPSLEWVADTRDKIRHLEADLLDQGIKLSRTHALANTPSFYGARSSSTCFEAAPSRSQQVS